MTKRRVIEIVQNTPYKDLIDFLLERANLSEKEHNLIYARAKEGATQEEYAEKIGYSPRHYVRLEDKAFAKVIRNWKDLDFLKML